MLEPVAPVRQRHVVVDADEIDLRIGPERIEVEEHVAAAVARLVAEILRPVGGVADLRAGPEDRAHIREQIPIGLHRRIGAGARADRGQPAHLGADQEGVDPARRRAEMGVVQDHPAQAPVAGGPVQLTLSPETLKLAGVPRRRSAATCAAAVAVLSTVPAKPAAGEQVIRPRQGKAGWPISAALSEYGFGRCCRAARPSG
jgi:hypothetical protein